MAGAPVSLATRAVIRARSKLVALVLGAVGDLDGDGGEILVAYVTCYALAAMAGWRCTFLPACSTSVSRSRCGWNTATSL